MSDSTLPGEASDDVPAILDCGRSDIKTLFLSMAERHPEHRDADYLRWHTLDHRPEQMRLASIRSSLRVVSTPGCRAVRAASGAGVDAIDHVMTYFFTGTQGLQEFNTLSEALRDAGRSPFILSPVERGVYQVQGRRAAARDKVGADVLPWLPTRGVYILLEEGEAANAPLLEVAGVAGVWDAVAEFSAFSTAPAGQRLSFCFLNDDPVAVARRLRPVLERRWREHGIACSLAAPFYTVVPYQWHDYLP